MVTRLRLRVFSRGDFLAGSFAPGCQVGSLPPRLEPLAWAPGAGGRATIDAAGPWARTLCSPNLGWGLLICLPLLKYQWQLACGCYLCDALCVTPDLIFIVSALGPTLLFHIEQGRLCVLKSTLDSVFSPICRVNSADTHHAATLLCEGRVRGIQSRRCPEKH